MPVAARPVRPRAAPVVAALLALVGAAGSDAVARPPAVLLGDQRVEAGTDDNRAGVAEAFGTIASASGAISSIRVYVASDSTATTLAAGVYADRDGHPGLLLTQGAVRAPSAAGWSTVLVPAARVVVGRRYWISLLSPAGSGTLRFRNRCCDGGDGADETSAETRLRALPPTWTTGATYRDAPVSAYATAVVAAAHGAHRGPGLDKAPPARPPALAAGRTTTSSIALSWGAATDNVGVVGYDMYRNGTSVGTTGATRYSFSGLSCGTTYTLAVAAYDAAGNRSALSSLTATTGACSTGTTASVFLDPAGSDSNACTQAAPCRSFQRGFNVAQPGHIVQLAGGDYGSQSLTGIKPAPGVTFQPAAGATASVYELDTGDFGPAYAGGLTFRNLVVSTRVIAIATQRLTLDNIDARNFYLNGVQDVLIKGGNWGPCTSSVDPCDNSKIDRYDATSGYQNQNITIDGALFHDYRTGNLTDHFECLIVFAGSDIAVRNSRFRNCEYFDIFMQYIDGTKNFTNITLENDFFDTPWNGRGCQCRSTGIAFSQRGNYFDNILVRYNSFRETTGISWTDGDPGGFKGATAVGNLIGKPTCMRGVISSDNLFIGGRCSPTDRSVRSFEYVDQAGGDYHLTRTSPAIGAGSPIDHPPTDIDGEPRPSTPDAGADQHS